MPEPIIRTKVITKGSPPFCLKTAQQCRGFWMAEYDKSRPPGQWNFRQRPDAENSDSGHGSLHPDHRSASGIAPAMPGYYGAVFAEVEVNTNTGAVKVVKLTSAFDVGKAINPEFVKGRIVGGGVMGIGLSAGVRLTDLCMTPEAVLKGLKLNQ